MICTCEELLPHLNVTVR